MDSPGPCGPSEAWRSTLESILADHPRALVAALGGDARMRPIPASLPVGNHRRFERSSGIDLVVADDRQAIIDAWRQAQVEEVVPVQARLLVDPLSVATLYFVDVRAEHGVHAVVVDVPNPERLFDGAEALERRQGQAGHAKRDGVGVFLEVDAALTVLLGWSEDELVGTNTTDLVHPEDMARAVESWLGMRAESRGRVQVRLRRADGRYLWLEVTNDNRLDDQDAPCVVSEFVDISPEMAELEALQDRERMLQRLAEALPIGVCHLRPGGHVAYANAPLVELLGPITDAEALAAVVIAGDRHLVRSAVDRAMEGRPSDVEVGVVVGVQERRCELTFRPMTTGDAGVVDGVILCAADVTDRSRLRAELEHRASHDALSGCLNRAATVAALERALRVAEQVAVAYLDLDHFKAINDELGHAAGDEVLRVVAARLRGVTRLEDTLGRIGGDEFVVICPQGHDAIEAAALAERFRVAVCGDVTFAQHRIPLTASIGVAVSHGAELDADALLSRADAAMYEAKRRARRQSSPLRAVPRPATS